MRYLEEKPEGTIFIIPVRLDDCELPYFIREIQWVDYPADYDRLVTSLQLRAGGSAMPQKTQKPKTKKSASTKSTPRTTSGNVFNIEGGIHVGRDYVVGNQNNVYYQNQQTFNITSPSQFIDELQKLKMEIERLKSQPDVDRSAARRMDMVQADIDDAIEEAAKEPPVLTRRLKAPKRPWTKLAAVLPVRSI
jgi:hypothetical protein